MKGNLATAEERLNYLNTSLHLHNLGVEAEDKESGSRAKSSLSSAIPRKVSSPTVRSNISRAPRNNRAAELRMKSINPPSPSQNSKSSIRKDKRGKRSNFSLKPLSEVDTGISDDDLTNLKLTQNSNF